MRRAVQSRGDPTAETLIGTTGELLRVLIVDDNRASADTMSMLVGVWGHDVRRAYDGTTGLALAAAYQPDVLLLDIIMPGITGLEVARRVRQQARFQDCFIIAVTGRTDFILLSDRAGPIPPEQPDGALNGYKLTLNDPYANATDNIPPSSHEGAALADSLTLWRITAPDDRWRVVGSIPLGATDDIRDGWNLRARRDVDGTWSIGFANGSIGQVPALTSLGIDAGAPALSAFDFISYAGVGWTAPNNTTNDHTDFGFDNFRVVAIPEPAGAFLAVIAMLFGAFNWWRR
jgi:CheY-like chemotaxis protein